MSNPNLRDGKNGEEKWLKTQALVLVTIMGLCFILVPIVSYLFGGWTAYWGHAVLAIVFAIAVTLIKTAFYWEDE